MSELTDTLPAPSVGQTVHPHGHYRTPGTVVDGPAEAAWLDDEGCVTFGMLAEPLDPDMVAVDWNDGKPARWEYTGLLTWKG